jgi:hypothetical protein
LNGKALGGEEEPWMRLEAADGAFLELQVVGYEFPDATSSPYDSNWLIVVGRVGYAGREWQFRDPCLLTYEAVRLCAWLEGVGCGSHVQAVEDFVEPDLAFSLVSAAGVRALRVALELEARPDWAQEEPSFALEFPLAELDLGAAARDLRAQLARFPRRAEV